MIDIDTQLNTFLSQNFETEVLEFKEAKNGYDFDSLGEYFSALSNEANLKGHDEVWLIFGVKDKDKSIVGTQFRADQAKLHSLKAEIANHTTNRITFKEIHEVMTDKGRVMMKNGSGTSVPQKEKMEGANATLIPKGADPVTLSRFYGVVANFETTENRRS